MKILIVDDDATTRKLLGLYLKTKGYEIAYAENGLDAIEKVGREKPNLIITDLNMPYMDGIEFVKTMRADPARQELPILMVTTEADPEERERAMSVGVNGYLVKPVTADVVIQNIRHILKNMFAQGGSSHA
ncbi:MAG TPA: response regulator [Nitrospirota bacterium]|nr:response regulator [Nitrospirota bacterium]